MEKDLIFDLGMHVGQDTEYYLKKGFRVIAVEANPLLVEQAKRKFEKWIHDDRLLILNCGITKTAGKFPFYVNNQLSQWSSFEPELGSREYGAYEIEVKGVPLQDLFAKYGVPYFIKIDIEGNDGIAVEAILDWKKENGVIPKYISVENGGVPILENLIECGYTQFKYIDQSTMGGTVAPRPSLEGIDLSYRFSQGSSGPFGKDSSGKWKSYDELLPTLSKYHQNRPPAKWYDLHATFHKYY